MIVEELVSPHGEALSEGELLEEIEVRSYIRNGNERVRAYTRGGLRKAGGAYTKVVRRVIPRRVVANKSFRKVSAANVASFNRDPKAHMRKVGAAASLAAGVIAAPGIYEKHFRVPGDVELNSAVNLQRKLRGEGPVPFKGRIPTARGGNPLDAIGRRAREKRLWDKEISGRRMSANSLSGKYSPMRDLVGRVVDEHLDNQRAANRIPREAAAAQAAAKELRRKILSDARRNPGKYARAGFEYGTLAALLSTEAGLAKLSRIGRRR